MNQIKTHTSFSIELSVSHKRKLKGIEVPNEIGFIDQEISTKQNKQTTFQGGFFMHKNEVQITD